MLIADAQKDSGFLIFFSFFFLISLMLLYGGLVCFIPDFDHIQ